MIRMKGGFEVEAVSVWNAVPCVVVCGLAVVAAAPLGLAAQVAHIEATRVEAESAEGYSRISAVRELSDGRVIVVDELERYVYLLDRDLSRERMIGGHGQGPGEYQQPSEAVPIEGDSTAVRTGRGYMVVTPEGESAGFLPRERRASHADRHGYLYGTFTEVRRGLGPPPEVEEVGVDSVPIERWPRGDPDAGELVAMVPVLRQPSAISERVPFRTGPQRVISAEGAVFIVHPEPYRVEVVRRDGSRAEGRVQEYEPIPVSEGHKEAWREERSQPRVVLRTRIGGDPGESSIGTTSRPVTEPRAWPRTLPPFTSRALRVDLEERLWVERTTEAGAPRAFDVFGTDAERVARVTLPHGLELAGFGEGALYAIRTDEADLQYLQRIALPGR